MVNKNALYFSSNILLLLLVALVSHCRVFAFCSLSLSFILATSSVKAPQSWRPWLQVRGKWNLEASLMLTEATWWLTPSFGFYVAVFVYYLRRIMLTFTWNLLLIARGSRITQNRNKLVARVFHSSKVRKTLRNTQNARSWWGIAGPKMKCYTQLQEHFSPQQHTTW